MNPTITPEELIEWIFHALQKRYEANQYGPFRLTLPNYCVGVLDDSTLSGLSVRDRIKGIQGIQEIHHHDNDRTLIIEQIETEAPSVLNATVPVHLL